MTWQYFPMTAPVDWSDTTTIDAINELADALDERVESQGNTPPNLQVSVGDDVQAASFWSAFQSEVEDAAWQTATRGKWFDHDQDDVAGDNTFIIGYDNTQDYWNMDRTRFRVVASLPAKAGQGGFTRKYPREIASTAEAGSNGQIARNLGDGGIYEHNGTSWELRADQKTSPDILTAGTPGLMQAGDYILVHVFNELYQAIDAMRWRVAFAGDYGTADQHMYCHDFSERAGNENNESTWADAKSGAESAGVSNETYTAGDVNKQLNASTQGNRDGSDYDAGVSMSFSKFWAEVFDNDGTFDADVYLYLYTGMNSGVFDNATFDANGAVDDDGAAIIEGWNLVHVEAGVGPGDNFTTPSAWPVTNFTTWPPTWVAEPADGDTDFRGWSMRDDQHLITLFKWDFTHRSYSL